MASRKQVLSNKRSGRGYQYKIAKRLGGKSVGTIEGQDITVDTMIGGKTLQFSFEAKKRKSFIGQTFMVQAIKNCPQDRIPLVIVHETGQFHDNDILLIRLLDWEKIIGGKG